MVNLARTNEQMESLRFEALNPIQMRVLADLSEEYSDSICHITTRQDIQLHYVHIEDVPGIGSWELKRKFRIRSFFL